jgi:iron complex outermembrane receptor protein
LKEGKIPFLVGGLCCAALAISRVAAAAEYVEATPKPSTQPSPASAPSQGSFSELKNLSLEELMNIPVSSVAKRESTVGQSPAAISVITNDDIRRSGATSIPEALRMSPGLEVAQINSSSWAITSRGFNGTTANKLLVLIDGRSVYTPLFGGVFWDVQDTLMEDINRIEVIRGPAGTLWGDNAVNGVINVITKNAADTQGLLVTGGGGTFERAFGGVRYGWKIGDDVAARVYVKHFERAYTQFPNGASAGDDWQMTQGGFRVDAGLSRQDHLSVHGDLYDGTESNLVPSSKQMFSDSRLFGANLLGLWTHDLGNGNDLHLQMYYDRTNRNLPTLSFAEGRDTFDVDFQNHLRLGLRHDLTWGLEYRVTTAKEANGPLIFFVPDSRTVQTTSAFIQDEIELVEKRLRLTIGSKFEYNSFSGFEVQPNARLLWNIDARQNTWGAISRAVRTPTDFDRDLRVNFRIPNTTTQTMIRGNPHFESEEVVAYELGYRIEPRPWVAFDVAAFYNNYDHLESNETTIFQSSTPPPLHTVFSSILDNKLLGDTFGGEVAATFKPADWWTVRAAYTRMEIQLRRARGSTNTSSVLNIGNDPDNQVYLRSSWDLPYHVELDVSARYVDPLPHLHVPSYISADVRLGWRPNDHLELAVVGQNLLTPRHAEFNTAPSAANPNPKPTEIPRGVYGSLTYRW